MQTQEFDLCQEKAHVQENYSCHERHEFGGSMFPEVQHELAKITLFFKNDSNLRLLGFVFKTLSRPGRPNLAFAVQTNDFSQQKTI